MIVSLRLKILDFFFHAGRETIVRVLKELIMLELPRVLALRKESEEEGKLWQLKKSVLSGSTIFIHRLANNRKIHGVALKVDVIFVVAMAKNQHFEHV